MAPKCTCATDTPAAYMQPPPRSLRRSQRTGCPWSRGSGDRPLAGRDRVVEVELGAPLLVLPPHAVHADLLLLQERSPEAHAERPRALRVYFALLHLVRSFGVGPCCRGMLEIVKKLRVGPYLSQPLGVGPCCRTASLDMGSVLEGASFVARWGMGRGGSR